MSNFAAVYGLARSGAFNGLFDADFGLIQTAVYGVQDAVDRIKKSRKKNADKEWKAPVGRFADAPFRSQLVENYLKGGAKLVWNTDRDWESSVKITTKKGKEVSFKGQDLKKEEASQYRDFIEKKLEMIEPPSFLEKLMVANKTLAASKSAKIAGVASLGVVPAAVGVAALSARAYGATRGFVMEKLNLRAKSDGKNKQSFKERLADIKHREEYKKDLKILSGAEDVMQKVENQKILKKDFLARESDLRSLIPDGTMAGTAASKEFQDLVKISDNSMLAGYLEGRFQLYGNGSVSRQYVYHKDEDAKQDLVVTDEKKTLKSAEVTPYIARYAKALEMIEPPTKTELTLLKQLYQLHHPKLAPAAERQPLVEAVAKTLDLYMTEKQKDNKDFGKTNLMNRLNDLRKHSIVDNRLKKMINLHSTLKEGGR